MKGGREQGMKGGRGREGGFEGGKEGVYNLYERRSDNSMWFVGGVRKFGLMVNQK